LQQARGAAEHAQHPRVVQAHFEWCGA
jgi:hypothetical protein